jgi:hypothetical protein
MNRIIITMALLLPFSITVYAQKSERVTAIYLTATDFANQKKSYSYNTDSSKYSINLNHMFNGKYVVIHSNKQKIKLAKDSLFGYTKADGTLVRFVGKNEYSLIYSSDSFCIYRAPLPRNSTGRINVTPYYYSTSNIGTIKKLTIANIKKEYNNEPEFCKKIDSHFQYNTDLFMIDNSTNNYKLISLLPQRIKTNNQ